MDSIFKNYFRENFASIFEDELDTISITIFKISDRQITTSRRSLGV